MPRGLDHVAHAVHDLDAAAAFYARLGFTVGTRNRHAPDWGTQNHIVQLPGFFVELLGLANTRAIAPHAERFFSFGAFNRDFLSRGQGLSMLVLEGRDSAAECATFRNAGIGEFAVYAFEREARRPDGTPTKVGFSLAFARDARAPDIGFFASHQHYPEHFWNSACQQHANGVASIAGVVLVAQRPDAHRDFLRAFTGETAVLTTAAGISLGTPRGEIRGMLPAAFASEFGTAAPDTTRGARLAALCLAATDFAVTRAALQAGAINFVEMAQRLVVGPETALGATLVFECAATGQAI